MTQENRTTLKTYFNTGDAPTEAQFVTSIDSSVNINEDIENGTEKPVPVNADKFSIWDSVAGVLKTLTLENLKTAIGFVANSVTIAKASPHYKTRVTANVVTNYAIDRNNGSIFELTMTGATTFTDSNLASGTDTEDISMILDGNFVPTFPAYWEATPSSDSYDGSVRNLLIIETVNGTGGSEDVIYSLENLSA